MVFDNGKRPNLVSRDVQFIVDKYYPSSTTVFSGQISRDYVRPQGQAILSLFNYHNWSPNLVENTIVLQLGKFGCDYSGSLGFWQCKPALTIQIPDVTSAHPEIAYL